MFYRIQKCLTNKSIAAKLKRVACESVRSTSDTGNPQDLIDQKNGRRLKVAITHAQVPRKAMDLMAASCDIIQVRSNPPRRMEVLSAVKGADGIFWGSSDKLDAEVLDAAGDQLKVVSVRTSNFDYVDVDELKKRNIKFGNTHVNAGAVADVAIGLMLNAARRIQEGRIKILTDSWQKHDFEFMLGRDIHGSIVGFFGFGNVGQEIAKRLAGFDIKGILYTDPVRASESFEKRYDATPVTFDDMIAASDVVFCCAPPIEETRKIFNRSTFEKMKNTAVFINMSSGSECLKYGDTIELPLNTFQFVTATVDQKDLYDALKGNQIFAAGLDVIIPEPLPATDPLMTIHNLVITPHLGARTRNTNINMSVRAAENILFALAGKPMISSAFKK